MAIAMHTNGKPTLLDGIKVIDVDTHISEWKDLWTSRAPTKLKTRVPQIKSIDGKPIWVIDEDKSMGLNCAASAVRKDGVKPGGADFYHWQNDDVHPASYDVNARIETMDQENIFAQIAYGNVLGFGGQKAFLVDPTLRLLSTQIYNDAMMELQAQSGNRIFPMILLPWWDVDLAIAEVKRCQKLGAKGINTNPDPHTLGLPDLAADYWTPLWHLVSEMGLPLNFHIGASDSSMSWGLTGAWPSIGKDAELTFGSTMLFLGNARVLTNILLSRFLERFPELKIVSVESGAGWIPFILEAVEYQMKEAHIAYKVSPWEIFQRQVFACTWFEKKNFVDMMRVVGVDNVMFETDFPHPTCLYPDPLHYMDDSISKMTLDERRKVFSSNAAKVYGIPI
jgi:predicted TIM-barrel fold metal-dependent hydrolase